MELSSTTSYKWCKIKCMLFDENSEIGISGCEVYLGTSQKSYKKLYNIGYRFRLKKNTEYIFYHHNIYFYRQEGDDNLQFRFYRLHIKFQDSIQKCEHLRSKDQTLISKYITFDTYDLIFPCELDDLNYITEPVTSTSTNIISTAVTTPNPEKTKSSTQSVTTKHTDKTTSSTPSSTVQKTKPQSTDGSRSTTESVTVPKNTDGSSSTTQNTAVKKTSLPTSDGEKSTTLTTISLTTNGNNSTIHNKEHWSKKDFILLSFMILAISLLAYDIISRRMKSARVRNLLYGT
ncbi:hypothetical protein RF11_00893 [Thelohanellus kitauei]|uniref:Uncharacterized protein n=1 Tax=Thelohanellus kitauei TaxID=669202 RepID=A0A0C2NAE8_THEKT|nr:hypothetical protein RF11_00893 [Thelohanellus kitauei]